MPFSPSTGVYTPASGAENAAPGQVIRSATWNSIFTDLSGGLTTLMQEAAFIEYVVDGGGAPITTGQKGYLQIPFACTISSWQMMADQTGSMVMDIWMVPFASFPPTNVNSITGSAMPNITAAQSGNSSTLTGWTTAIPTQSVLAFDIISTSNQITRVTLVLTTKRNTAS